MVPSVSLLTGFDCIFLAKKLHTIFLRLCFFIFYLFYLIQEAKAVGVEKGEVVGWMSWL